MKTNQNMIRKMGSFDVIQRTQDGMFNATTLLRQWNDCSGMKKELGDYFENKSTNEFINTIIERENPNKGNSPYSKNDENLNIRNSVYLKTRGANGGTWMHPLLFIDFAMWINPSFKYDVLKFVYDELIKYRNEAGDAYRQMSSSIQKIVTPALMPSAMTNTAKALNHIVYGKHEAEIRNTQAEESKVKELCELEKNISMLIDCGYIKNFEQVLNHLRQAYSKKHLPKYLRA